MKNKNLKFALLSVIALIVAMGIAGIINLVAGVSSDISHTSKKVWKNYNSIYEVSLGLVIPTAQAEIPMKEWVLNEVEKAGLDTKTAECIIYNESKWDEWATGWNTNGSIDYGIWQINSIHKKTISVGDRYNYKTATKWAIEKRLHDGNWGAWVAYNKCK